MADREATRKSAAEKRADKENPSGEDVKREDVTPESLKDVKEPVDPAEAPKEPVGNVGDPEIAKQEQERLEQGEAAVDRQRQKSELDAVRELHEQAMRDGLKSVEPTVDALDRENGRLGEQRDAEKIQRERMQSKLLPRRVDRAVGSMEEVELELEPTDEAQRRFTINVIVHGEVDDARIIIRTVDEERVAPDYKAGRVYESPRFGTKNRVRAIAGEEPGELAGEYTDLGKFQTTPMRLAPGNYEVVLETTGGIEVAQAEFTLLGDAVDSQGQPIPEDHPVVVARSVVDEIAEPLERQRLDVTGEKFLDAEIGRQTKRYAKQERAAKTAAAKE